MNQLSLARHLPVDPPKPNTDARFTALYEQYADRINRYVAVRVGSPQEVEDLVAQTFFRALKGLRRGWDGESLSGWLFGIARHVVADFYRSRQDIIALIEARDVIAPGPSPGEIVDQHLQLERVANALKTLSPDRAEALALRIFGGLSADEVADLMGKTPQAVKMLVYRAVQDLKTRLGYTAEES